MASLLTRKFFRALELFNLAVSIKRKVQPIPKAFLPCTPFLPLGLNKAFRIGLSEGWLEGTDYLEFGIFRGFTLWYAQATACDLGIQDMRFFGFDSFSGLPKIKSIDIGGEFQEGAYYCPRKDVEDYLNYYNVDWNKTFLVEGWFDKTLNDNTIKKLALRKCSICVIDCDLYESSKLVMKFISHLIKEKTILLFDDWNNFGGSNSKGERLAYTEFLLDNPHLESEPLYTFGNHGQAMMIKNKNEQ